MATRKERDPERELDNLLDALAESVLNASDEELLEEVRAEGRDPLRVAAQMEDLLLGAVKAHCGPPLRTRHRAPG